MPTTFINTIFEIVFCWYILYLIKTWGVTQTCKEADLALYFERDDVPEMKYIKDLCGLTNIPKLRAGLRYNKYFTLHPWHPSRFLSHVRKVKYTQSWESINCWCIFCNKMRSKALWQWMGVWCEGGIIWLFTGVAQERSWHWREKIEVRFSIDHITKQRKGLPFCDDEDVLLHHHHKMPSHTISITFFWITLFL